MCRFVFSPFSHDEHPSLAFGCLAASSGCTALSCEPDFMAFSLKCKLRGGKSCSERKWSLFEPEVCGGMVEVSMVIQVEGRRWVEGEVDENHGETGEVWLSTPGHTMEGTPVQSLAGVVDQRNRPERV